VRRNALVAGAIVTASALLYLGIAGRGSGSDPDVRIDGMKATVAYLTSLHPPRNHRNAESLERAAKYIRDAFARSGLTPVEQEFEAGGRRYVNVVARVGPEGRGTIVVGAHYDVCGDQPGADDNASGVAALLEIARFAKREEGSLGRAVEFVAYALEEPPFFGTRSMGSYVHAEALWRRGEPVRAMICLETIGYFSEERGSQAYPSRIFRLLYPDRGNFIAVVGNVRSGLLVRRVAKYMKTASIDVETLTAPPSVPGVDASDHRNYWDFGYRAVMITDTAFYRNGKYHTAGDTMETLSFDRMKEVARGVCRAIVHL